MFWLFFTLAAAMLVLFWIGVIVGMQLGREKEQNRLHDYMERGKTHFERGNHHLQIARGLYKETNRLCRLSWSFLQDSRHNPNNRPDWNKEAGELPSGLDKNDL